MCSIKIACLPVAGKANPYQYLMIEGLNSSKDISAFNGVHNKFLGIIITALKYRPDYIHFDWESSYYWRKYIWLTYISIPLFMIQLLVVRYLLGIKLVWTPHNIVPHDLPHPKLHHYIRKFFARQMYRIRLFSEKSIERASAEFKVSKDRFVIMPEGSYVGYYPNETNKAESIQKLSLPADKIHLLYLGYIKPYKGIDTLVDAFYEQLDNRFHLIIAGKVMDYPFYDKVKSQIKDRIQIFDQFIPEEELQYFYHASDVVVLPFKKIENSGSAILAMGFSKAIVAPSEGVLPERLSQQKDLLYTNGIEEGLQKLCKVTGDYLYLAGQKNQESLLKNTWEDFARIFQK